METTAHHQDLRAPSLSDPPELTEVRRREESIIATWIERASRAPATPIGVE